MATPLTKKDNLPLNITGLIFTLGVTFVVAYTISKAWQKGQEQKSMAKS